MSWIEQVQRDVGGTVVAFATQYWAAILLVVVVLASWALFGGKSHGEIEHSGFFDGDADGGD